MAPTLDLMALMFGPDDDAPDDAEYQLTPEDEAILAAWDREAEAALRAKKVAPEKARGSKPCISPSPPTPPQDLGAEDRSTQYPWG